MKGKKSENSDNEVLQRRKALLALTGLGGSAVLSKTWVKPVVDSVMLPAHATTSIVRVGSCSVTTPATDILLVNGTSGGNFDPAIPITLTNTGAEPLVGIAALIVTFSPSLGTPAPTLFFPAGSIPNPLPPGATHITELVSISGANFPTTGTLTFQYTSDLTSCEVVIPVDSQELN